MDTWPAATLIRSKRRGDALDATQCSSLARGVADGSWSEGQIAAFCMAVAWRGMAPEECRDFTLALRDSGRCLDWSDLPGPVLDKHSTGGVGDAVSLALAPLVAACGGFVPFPSSSIDIPRACERPPACKLAGRNDGSGKTHRKGEYTNATAPVLPGLKPKRQQETDNPDRAAKAVQQNPVVRG